MLKMNRLFINLINFVRLSKKFFIIGGLSFIGLYLLLFPYTDLIENQWVQISKKIPQAQVDYSNLSLGIFPPRLILKNAEITSSFLQTPLLAQSLVIKPNYLSLFALKLGAVVRLNFKDSYISFSAKQLSSKAPKKLYRIEIISKSMPIRSLSAFSPFFQGAKGIVNLDVDIRLSPSSLSNLEVSGNFQAQLVELQPHSLSIKNIGVINFPLLQWGSAAASLKISNGQILLDRMVIGELSDSLYINTKGSASYEWKSFRRRFKKYNIDLEIRMDNKFKSRFVFIDLFLSKTKHLLSPQRTGYKANISGTSSSNPKIKKIAF